MDLFLTVAVGIDPLNVLCGIKTAVFPPVDIIAVGESMLVLHGLGRSRPVRDLIVSGKLTIFDQIGNDELRRQGVLLIRGNGALRARHGRDLKGDIFPELRRTFQPQRRADGDGAVVLQGDAHRTLRAVALIHPGAVVPLPVVGVAERGRVHAVNGIGDAELGKIHGIFADKTRLIARKGHARKQERHHKQKA